MIDDGRAGTSAPGLCLFSWSNSYLSGLVSALFHCPYVNPYPRNLLVKNLS